ncbi:MAG: 2OG-Fe(II) oxygenase [Pseudomonadota bacterium]
MPACITWTNLPDGVFPESDMLFQELTLEKSARLNASLYARFMALSGTDRTRQSHYFQGRFENIYIKEADIPDIAALLDVVKQQAGQLLGVPAATLRAGFWFNAMEAGHRTVPHHHDENDELLSAVYYIRVPENSGDLILHENARKIVIQAQEGKLVLFAPAVLHEVTANSSSGLRLSVGMNVGPADG